MTGLEVNEVVESQSGCVPHRGPRLAAKRRGTAPLSGTSLRPLIGIGTMLLGLYLLFQHGCHRDIDDEPGILVDQMSREKPDK